MPVHILQPDGSYEPPLVAPGDDPSVAVGGGADGYVRLASGVIVPASAAQGRTDLGLGTAATHPAGDFATAVHTHAEADVTDLTTDLAAKLAKASNLSDLASAVTARANLGLGSLATKNVSIGPDRVAANAPIFLYTGTGGQAIGLAALKPVFYPVDLFGMTSFTLQALAAKVSTLLAASTVGLAVYSVTYPSSAHVSATLVAQLNASISGAAAGYLTGDVTTGAAGSGAAAYTMDLTANRYLVGCMVSDTATLRLTGINATASFNGMGFFQWASGSAARSSVTDWPASFTETSVSVSNTGFPLVDLVTATGKMFL